MKRQDLEITLYGTQKIGHGWLAMLSGAAHSVFGDGTPVSGRSMSEAIWSAVEEANKRADVRMIKFFAPGGEMVAEIDYKRTGYVPNAGSLPWRAAR